MQNATAEYFDALSLSDTLLRALQKKAPFACRQAAWKWKSHLSRSTEASALPVLQGEGREERAAPREGALRYAGFLISPHGCMKAD